MYLHMPPSWPEKCLYIVNHMAGYFVDRPSYFPLKIGESLCAVDYRLSYMRIIATFSIGASLVQ